MSEATVRASNTQLSKLYILTRKWQTAAAGEEINLLFVFLKYIFSIID